jgi:signal transduction histidine kinase/CheY-like chemotaxis protein
VIFVAQHLQKSKIKHKFARNLNITKMNLYILLTLAIAAVAIILAFLGRLAYMRSIRLRQKLRMSYVFTNITHELLTPLTVLSASVDKMRDDAPQFSHDYDLMQINIQRMVRMLQQILETSKSQAGQLKLLCAQGDVMRYIRETAQYLEPLIVKKKMKYTIECQPESMMGWIDTDKLDKIIYNLVSNAAKYCRENGEVNVRVTTNTRFDRIRIVVSDTGFGIPKEKMKTLFRPFQDGSYRQHHNIGTGLGLALTHDLVYLHKGTIKCESEIDKGTTFTVELPINKEAYSPEQIYEDHQITFNNGKNPYIEQQKSIPTEIDASLNLNELPQQHDTSLLIVEDNPELLMLMHQLLSTYYNIYIATNGLEALKIIQDKPIDLIISDIMMPEMDGFELTKRLKDDPDYAHLPIVLLTAKREMDNEQKALVLGADDYLTKPFKLKELKLRVDNIIQNRKRARNENKLEEAPQEEQPRELTPDELFLQRVRQCVLDHLEDDEYDRDTLASNMGASASTLYNKLRAIANVNVTTFIRGIRMEEAKRIATENPDIRISDLAYRVGFRDPRYFSTTFKKHFGMQPTEFLDTLKQKS